MKQIKKITNFDSNQVNPFFYDRLKKSFNSGIEKFQKELDYLIHKDEEATIKTTLLFLNSRNRISRLFELVISSDLFLNKMLKSSYYHKNGFDKIVLLQSNSFKIRIHNFDPIYIGDKNIHDHRWLFGSTILKGSFEMSLYDESNYEGEKRFKNTYESSGKVTNDGYVYLKERENLLIHRGMSYFMPTEELHDIKGISNSGAISLMMTGISQKTTCKLYSASKIYDSGKNKEPISIEKISSTIHNINQISNPFKVA